MSNLVVTTRCPISYDKAGGKVTVRHNAGGVSNSLDKLMAKEGGTWICWGDGTGDREHEVENHNGYTIVRLFLSQGEKKGFYDGYSNGTLWPLFHYFRERIKYTQSYYYYYDAVNRHFAEVVSRQVMDGDTIWIHDYQLALLPGLLRANGIHNPILFTWHIPWVSGEFFGILPESKTILSSLASCDAVTFHTGLYRDNFVESCNLILGRDDEYGKKAFAIPLGIDYEHYANSGRKIKNPFPDDRKTIFSIDRLDYTKGLTDRVLAVRTLLERHPELLGKFSYVLVVTPSRTSIKEYLNAKRDLEMNIGRVNGEFGTVNWVPIIYIYKRISEASLLSYYRHADVALITPLMDGLNLVSKEFIAASRSGVLVLSKFAGSSEELKDAITVNPNSHAEVADAIYSALTMNRDEAVSRLESMKNAVRKRDISWWLGRISRRMELQIAEREELGTV